MESQIRTIGLLITFVATIYALRRGRDMPALVFLVLAPFSYFAQNLFVVFTPAKLMGLIFLGGALLKPSYISALGGRYVSAFLPYFFYLLTLTIIMPLGWPEHSVDRQGFLYGNTARGFVQIFQMVMGLSIIAVIIRSLTSANSLLRAQVALLVTMVVVSAYGIYVWFAQRLGLPFNPIDRQGKGGELGREIVAVVDGVYRMRAYSLTGEPKTLAVNACSGLMLVFFTAANQTGFTKNVFGKLLLAFLFLTTLLLTLSTAGFVILPMMIILALAIQVRIGQVGGRFVVTFIVAVGLASLAMPFVSQFSIGDMWRVLDMRLTGRLSEDGFFTYADSAALSLLSDQPMFAVTGVGMGGSSFYVREYDVLSYAGFTAAPRGIIGFITDRGILGLLLFLIPMYNAARPLIALATSNSPNRRIYGGILILCAIHILLMFTAGQWHDEWLAIGLICAGATVASRERSFARTCRDSMSRPLVPGSATDHRFSIYSRGLPK